MPPPPLIPLRGGGQWCLVGKWAVLPTGRQWCPEGKWYLVGKWAAVSVGHVPITTAWPGPGASGAACPGEACCPCSWGCGLGEAGACGSRGCCERLVPLMDVGRHRALLLLGKV